jgi:hypothetical protein
MSRVSGFYIEEDARVISRAGGTGMGEISTQRYGGEGGIRTRGKVTPTHAFQACSFNHSDTSPVDKRHDCMSIAADPQVLKIEFPVSRSQLPVIPDKINKG